MGCLARLHRRNSGSIVPSPARSGTSHDRRRHGERMATQRPNASWLARASRNRLFLQASCMALCFRKARHARVQLGFDGLVQRETRPKGLGVHHSPRCGSQERISPFLRSIAKCRPQLVMVGLQWWCSERGLVCLGFAFGCCGLCGIPISDHTTTRRVREGGALR